MMSLVLILACLLGVVMLAVLLAGIVLIMNSGGRDVVSTARQGWINRRSDQDQEGW